MKSDEMLKSGRGVIIMDETMSHNKNVSYCPPRLRDCIFCRQRRNVILETRTGT